MEVVGEEKQPRNKDFQGRSLKSLKQGLERLLGRRSVTITEYDPCYKVAYLGNVLTGWAKGDSCTEKPLNTLWKNYTSNSKPDVQMKLIVTQSGLKAITKEHGLTEYWSHRITYCCAPVELPKIFCWVYRHEGRKLKQELRCHAVLCAKESVARQIANQLQARLTQALIEFKRDKISRQNARLSLANSVYDNPSLPRRKILLSTGSHNYRPPLERSKSAPKLMSIEESLEEEDEHHHHHHLHHHHHHHHHHHADYNGGGGGGGGTLAAKKFSKRMMDPKMKFATYRNLSYSNRGSRMGGLHGLRCRTPNAFLSMPSFHPSSISTAVLGNSSQYTKKQQRQHEEEQAEGEAGGGECGVDVDVDNVVEQNPLGSEKDCGSNNLLDLFEKDLVLDERTERGEKPIAVDINENICLSEANAAAVETVTTTTTMTAASEFFYRKPIWVTSSTTNEDEDDAEESSYSSCPPYTTSASASASTSTSVSTCSSSSTINASSDDAHLPKDAEELVRSTQAEMKCDSLVRSRKRLFEHDDKTHDERLKKCAVDDGETTTTTAVAAESSIRNLVKNRRKLFECANVGVGVAGETDSSSLLFDLTSGEDNRDSLECVGSTIDDESATPSLQSISSGSDTSSPRDIITSKLEYSKNYDLDSLWEEDSDESGFVEAIGQDANDDKIRDLPHHQLVKSCILSSKSHCVQV